MEANIITAHADQPRIDPRLQPTVDVLNQLSPANQELAIALIRQLAEHEGITVGIGPSTGLQDLTDGIPLWVAMLKSEGYSERTITEYKRVLRRVLRDVPQPTTQAIREWFAVKLTECAVITVAQCRNALKSFFTYLYEEGLWNVNPMNGIKPFKVPHRIRQDPSPEAVQRLLQIKFRRQRDTDKFRMMVALLTATGLRVSEAVTIRLDRINLDGDRPGIRVIGKGNKERIVPVTSPIVSDMLLSYIKRYCRDSSPYLFPGDNLEGHWGINGVNKALRRACQKQGIKPAITPHQLRHFFATWALGHGAMPKAVSQMLGHASVGITLDIYQHVHEDRMWQEHEKFAPLGGAPLLEEGREKHGDG